MKRQLFHDILFASDNESLSKEELHTFSYLVEFCKNKQQCWQKHKHFECK